ncbi:MAG: KTSC domain-containing protein [Alphaproteobacteria bacterium]|nr:KTSC domain-containing protein [Alphaproteobacteria bacterium]
MPSTVIASFRYFETRRELEVVFRSRRIYAYRNVPLETAQAMKAMFSKGEFFNLHIRDRYEFERRSDAAPDEPTLEWKGR